MLIYFRRAVADTVSNRLGAWIIGLIGFAFTLAITFLVRGPQAAAQDMTAWLISALGAVGALFLLFLINFARAPSKILTEQLATSIKLNEQLHRQLAKFQRPLFQIVHPRFEFEDQTMSSLRVVLPFENKGGVAERYKVSIAIKVDGEQEFELVFNEMYRGPFLEGEGSFWQGPCNFPNPKEHPGMTFAIVFVLEDTSASSHTFPYAMRWGGITDGVMLPDIVRPSEDKELAEIEELRRQHPSAFHF